MLCDEAYEYKEPSAWDEIRSGWHQDALIKLGQEDLNKVLNLVGAKTISEATKEIRELSKEEYIKYLMLIPE